MWRRQGVAARLGDEHGRLQLPVGVPQVRVPRAQQAARLRVQAARSVLNIHRRPLNTHHSHLTTDH